MEGTPPCSLEFVSVGCNSGANCMDWGRNGLVAYGGCNFVALYHPESFQTIATLCGHTGRVNAAKWIPNTQHGIENRWEQEEVELISASTDKTLIAWRKEQGKWVQTAQLKGHTEPVTAVSVVDLADGTLYAASTSVDATLRIWMRSAPVPNAPRNDAWVCVQTITRAPKMFESVSVARVPSSSSSSPSSRYSVIIAAAGVDGGIHLYVQQYDPQVQQQAADSQQQQQPFKSVVVLEGHQDWIRCLSFATTDDNTLLLASSSQDNRVRLWSVGPLKGSEIGNLLEGVDASETARISSKGHVVDINSQKYVVLLDAVLAVHEEWVYSIAWQPRTRQGDKVTQPMRLLSASMDRTMIVWEPANDGSGIWLDQARVGEMGGNTLGFYGCAFSPLGDAILAHGYNGAFHLWKQVKEKIAGEEGVEIEDITWQPVVTVSGHFAGVEDLSWDTTGSYFVSVSEDKTARAFAQWSDSTKLAKWPQATPARTTWHEIARPLIHGYELTTLAFVQGLRHRIVAGAEEKPLRVFDAPQTFVDSLEAISGQSLGADVGGVDRPLAASQPALGLSNKPYFAGGATPADDVPMPMGEDEGGPLELEQQRPFNPSAHSAPPFEEDLLQATLYPEIMKLYGHGNEVVAVACSNDGEIIASACKGTTPETSSIRLWNTKTWESVGVVQAHTLTVTQMVFSHDDKYLLTVSRDRQFCMLERRNKTDPAGPEYRVVMTKAKAHGRILWGCDWSHDDAVYATAARDQTVKVWSGVTSAKIITTIETQSPATAVAFAPRACADASAGTQYVLAVGEEDGRISLWTGSAEAGRKWTKYMDVPAHLGHVGVVRRLRWRINAEEERKKREEKEKEKSDPTKQLLLASCSADWSVRLFSLAIP